MIEQEFIPYKQALALKELGFDEPCFKKYIAGCLWSSPTVPEIYENIHLNSSDCLAPLYQQAFRFFRQKYTLTYDIYEIQVFTGEKSGYRFKYVLGKIGDLEPLALDESLLGQYSYEEAELECLKKLIEICKKK